MQSILSKVFHFTILLKLFVLFTYTVTKKSPASGGNHGDGTSNDGNKATTATKGDKVIGLSLVAHYGDDSDSDTDV